MRINSFLEKHKEKLVTRSAFVLLCPRRERAALTTHSTTTMIPFPADSAEFEEYTAVMESMADEAEASTPDPEPQDFGYSPDDESDELRASEDAAYWANLHEREDEPEDRYLDSYWEDQSEYGMEGCCGDF